MLQEQLIVEILCRAFLLLLVNHESTRCCFCHFLEVTAWSAIYCHWAAQSWLFTQSSVFVHHIPSLVNTESTEVTQNYVIDKSIYLFSTDSLWKQWSTVFFPGYLWSLVCKPWKHKCSWCPGMCLCTQTMHAVTEQLHRIVNHVQHINSGNKTLSGCGPRISDRDHWFNQPRMKTGAQREKTINRRNLPLLGLGCNRCWSALSGWQVVAAHALTLLRILTKQIELCLTLLSFLGGTISIN